MAKLKNGCPREWVTPCRKQCTYANPFWSDSCDRCYKYGSEKHVSRRKGLHMKTNCISLIRCGLLLTIIFCGCSSDDKRVQQDTIESGIGTGISVLTIDSCEYVWVKRGYSGGLSHKGNCKFCAERSSK